MLSDLRESGSIEQDADIVLMLYRENDQEGKKPIDEENAPKDNSQKPASYIVNCKIAKNRHGEAKTIQFHWDGQYTKFSTLGYIRNEQ